MTRHELVLIDGHALAYRTFYALPLEMFTTSTGEPTNATWGFARTLLDLLLTEEPPEYLAVSFDVGRTFRDDIFPAYKGTRAKMPEELGVQIGRIRQLVQTFNIPVLELDGYEADDVLGTIARQATPHGVPVRIITGDRDLLQLVDDHTTVELPPDRHVRQARLFDAAAVQEKLGITPRQLIDWKALAGDKSDNIPGVAGVGEKTAISLLNQYGDLDGIYANLAQIPARWRNKLEAGRDDAWLSRKLATIVTDAPITLDLQACVARDFDRRAVLALFRELEFRSLGERLHEVAAERTPAEQTTESGEEQAETGAGTGPTQVVVVRDQAALDGLVRRLEQAQVIAFDVETTGLDELSADLVGLCLAVAAPVAYYIPVGHLANTPQSDSGQLNLFAGAPERAAGQLPLATVLEALRPALTNPQIGKVAHNARYDYRVLQRAGLTVAPITFDTMIAEWLADPASKHLGLKDLARHRLGVEMQPIEALIGKGRQQKSFAEVPIEEAAPYGAADADLTLRLMGPLQAEIGEKQLQRVLELEMALVPVLARMEAAGIAIDVPFFEKLSAELDQRQRELESQIHAIAGRPFNINSTQQLSDVLFRELKLPHDRLPKTSSGHFSTASGVLEGVESGDERGIIRLILEYRELGKLRGTYTDALPALVHPQTGRIHTSFRQTGTVTGRLSSSDPNLQNIPIRTELGRQVRRGFVARPGWRFLAADYSQVELRILAHMSGDETLIQAFLDDQDIHSTTAASVYGIPLETVTFEQRRFAKAVNFGLMYGMGAYRLTRDSDLTLAESEQYIKEYFARFPGVRRYLDETKELARRQGYVETLMGRRRYFPVFMVRGQANPQFVARAEREAINHPIQGTAADIVKVAMIRLDAALQERGLRAQLLLQIHDELILEVPEEESAELKSLVEEIMSGAAQLAVPLKVEGTLANNWYDLK
jgi:DNA polymerase-1